MSYFKFYQYILQTIEWKRTIILNRFLNEYNYVSEAEFELRMILVGIRTHISCSKALGLRKNQLNGFLPLSM